MAAKFRGILEGNKSLSGSEVYKALKRKAAKTSVVKMKPAATATTVDLTSLQAAAKFVSEVGDADKAIRQLRSLQIQ
jgi:predicted negative regulator of RcsB-dependent stress response